MSLLPEIWDIIIKMLPDLDIIRSSRVSKIFRDIYTGIRETRQKNNILTLEQTLDSGSYINYVNMNLEEKTVELINMIKKNKTVDIRFILYHNYFSCTYEEFVNSKFEKLFSKNLFMFIKLALNIPTDYEKYSVEWIENNYPNFYNKKKHLLILGEINST